MTDKPAAPVPAAVVPAEDPAEDKDRPRNIWQWMVLFPTLGIALITAVPDWVDSVRAVMENVNDAKYSELLERSRMFTKNEACLLAPYQWYEAPSEGRIVDATLCPSGDLYIRVLVPDDNSPLATVFNGKKFMERKEFVSIDRIVERAEQFAAMNMLGLAAHAGTVPPQSLPGRQIVLAQDQFAFVICQKFVDERMLLRHLQVEGQCFDETVDTFTGATVSRVAVACRTTC